MLPWRKLALGALMLLSAVAAVSASDVWAVGHADSNSGSASLTLHWDGSVWRHVPSPSPGSAGNNLSGVAAVSANDIWAVGEQSGGQTRQALALQPAQQLASDSSRFRSGSPATTAPGC